MKLRWTQPTSSGLGDRLVDILTMLAYARCRGATLYMEWQVFNFRSDLDVSHRQTDILLENVVKYINFPSGIVFDVDSGCDHQFKDYVGGGHHLPQFWQEHMQGICSFDVFIEHVQRVGMEFSFCLEINDFLATIPKRFVSMHIRRGDKVRNEQPDHAFIHVSELERLDTLTYRAIDYCLSLGFDTFFFCGDEDFKKQPFIDYAVARGVKTFTIPTMEKWQATYFDMATMTRSDLNVASQRYSTFSRFPALIGRGNYKTVFDLEREGLI